MNERKALSFALLDSQGRYLFLKRHPDRKEFGNYWSLPTISVTPEGFEHAVDLPEIRAEMLQTVVRCRLNDPLRWISTEHRVRPGYALDIALCSTSISGTIDYDRQKYTASCWRSPEDMIDLFPSGGGACVSVLVRHLISSQRLSVNFPFVEVPPEFAVNPDPDNVRAWSNWASDQYNSLCRTDGFELGYVAKRLTVDRYFKRRAGDLKPLYASALDVGCGSGDFIAELKAAGYDAFGIDVSLPEALRLSGDALAANLESPDFELGRTFDLVFANLVLPWIADLDTFIANLLKCVKDRGRLILSILAPDYAKNGDWVEVEGRRGWLIDRPVRRPPQLAMINYTVGPLHYYPRSILDYISAFAAGGLYADRGSYLYIDSETTEAENAEASVAELLARHVGLPLFAVIEFVSAPSADSATPPGAPGSAAL